MEETIRGRADWGDRYIAFTNYDLQVLDVSEYLYISLVVGKLVVRVSDQIRHKPGWTATEDG